MPPRRAMRAATGTASRPGKARQGRPGSQETYLRPKAHKPSWKGVGSMPHSRPVSRIIPAVLGGLLSSLAFVSAAHAAAPANVTVRVEGISQTLLAPTAVTTNGTPVEKDGNKEHTCAGGSAAGA